MKEKKFKNYEYLNYVNFLRNLFQLKFKLLLNYIILILLQIIIFMLIIQDQENH